MYRLGFEIPRIRYLDDREQTDLDNVLNPFFRKRPAFSHEQEIRAAYIAWTKGADPEPEGKTLQFPIDPQALIEKVYIAPFAAGWFERAVKGLMERTGDSAAGGKPYPNQTAKFCQACRIVEQIVAAGPVGNPASS